MSTLNIALENQTTSNTVYAYITGRAINRNNAVVLIQADGHSPYYPSSPSSVGTALAADCSIPLGPPGTTKRVTVPLVAGGRIWFCVNDRLKFLLNPGPGLVEPSVSNQSDPNYNKDWGFCEFTFNSLQLFANISYVDFVSLPIALTLSNTRGGSQHVSGMPAGGLDTVCKCLKSQHAADGAGWDRLVVTNKGRNLRALSPNTGAVLNGDLFRDYFAGYLKSCWAKYTSNPLRIDTQAEWGTVNGQVTNGLLTFPKVGTFAQPSAANIFSCSTGPFAASRNNTAEMGALTARISAALNRSVLLNDGAHPESEQASQYYARSPTNHYARIVHAANLDGRGYAFPYDDVAPSKGPDQSGAVADGEPRLFTVTVGGINAHV